MGSGRSTKYCTWSRSVTVGRSWCLSASTCTRSVGVATPLEASRFHVGGSDVGGHAAMKIEQKWTLNLVDGAMVETLPVQAVSIQEATPSHVSVSDRASGYSFAGRVQVFRVGLFTVDVHEFVARGKSAVHLELDVRSFKTIRGL